MRIAHVSDCYPPRTGGIESQVSDLASRQAAAGHDVHVLTATLGAAGERGGVVDVERGVRVHRLGARIPFDLPVNPAGPRLLREAFDAVAPDVVHVHAGVLSPFAFDGVRVATELGLPVAITWHCMLDGAVPVLRTGARAVRWRSDRVALSAVSGAAAARVAEVFGRHVATVPNGMDLEAWAPRPAAPAEDATGRTARPVHLVATMRLAPRKRAVPLVGVVADAVRRLPPGSLRMTVIGSGPARARVESAIASQRLGGVVHLAGRLTREQVRAAYDDADIFLAPAELEAFGIAALEARTAGLAVVARRGTGIEEFVEDGVDGLLVADDAEMTEAVVHLVGDGRLLAGIRAHNRSTPPPFGWPRVLAAAEAEYTRAAGLVGWVATT